MRVGIAVAIAAGMAVIGTLSAVARPRPNLASLDIPMSKFEGEFRHSGLTVTTYRCFNGDGRAAHRIRVALAASGAQHQRSTDSFDVFDLDARTYVTVSVPPEYLGLAGKVHRFRTPKGQTYSVPMATLLSRAASPTDVSVTLIRRDTPFPWMTWF